MAGFGHRAGSAFAHICLKWRFFRHVRCGKRYGKKSAKKAELEIMDLGKEEAGDNSLSEKKSVLSDSAGIPVGWTIAGSVIFIVLCILVPFLKDYANTNGCESEFWNAIHECVAAILACGLFDVVVLFFSSVKKRRKIEKMVLVLNAFIGFLIMSLIVFLGMAFSEVKGAIAEKKEANVSAPLEDETNVVVDTPVVEGAIETKRVVQYDIDQDPYMNNKPLSDYYAGEISQDNLNNTKAKILFDNLDYNQPKGSNSKNYNDLMEVADFEYETYLDMRVRAKKTNDEHEMVFSDRIEMLQNSLDKREEADKEYESPENERPLAAGYKDMGDEYVGRSRQSDAIIAYEQGAEWYMKAIYHSAYEGKFEEMQQCLRLFWELVEEVEKLDEIDQGRRDKIRSQAEVYDEFVDMVRQEM